MVDHRVMATLNDAVAGLRIFGDDLDPAELSALLEASPTMSRAKGEEFLSGGATRVARVGSWILDAERSSPADLDAQIMGLLARLPRDLDLWRGLNARFKIDLFCGWFLEVANEGTSMEPETLSALGARGIRLSVDIYAGDRD
jgi:hypothetical protein